MDKSGGKNYRNVDPTSHENYRIQCSTHRRYTMSVRAYFGFKGTLYGIVIVKTDKHNFDIEAHHSRSDGSDPV